MNKLFAAMLVLMTATAAEAYDPAAASGYNQNSNRGLFEQDNTARKMQNEMARGGESKKMMQDLQAPAQKAQTDQENAFSKAWQPPKPPEKTNPVHEY